MLITKYFCEDVLDFVEGGSFRFGSTVSYSGQEQSNRNSEFRMSDVTEARLPQTTPSSLSETYVDGLHIGDVNIEDSLFVI